MTRLSSPFRVTAIVLLALGAISLSACGGGKPSTLMTGGKTTVAPCSAFTQDEASKMFGAPLKAFKLSGDAAKVKVCEFTDSKGNNYALIRIRSAAKIKDPAADLKSDAELNKKLFKDNVKPIVIHPADGFGPGAFYLDNTTGPESSLVQLNIIQNGYKIQVQVNNPKDFDSGEKQATDIMNQIFANIKNGSALVPM